MRTIQTRRRIMNAQIEALKTAFYLENKDRQRAIKHATLCADLMQKGNAKYVISSIDDAPGLHEFLANIDCGIA